MCNSQGHLFANYLTEYCGYQVFTVLVCMAIIISKVNVHWGTAFDGFVPSDSLFKSGALYTCKQHKYLRFSVIHDQYNLAIGIIGATVMPHSLFLGSALATQDRVTDTTAPKPLFTVSSATSSQSGFTVSTIAASGWQRFCQGVRHIKIAIQTTFHVIPVEHFANEPTTHGERENRPIAAVRAHIYHGMIDMVVSLLGFAVVINAL